MITLFELHWSHYCEKIRLALNYMQLPWQAVDIHPFSKKEMHQHPLAAQLPSYTVPAIFDDATQQFVMDSTPILRYLAKQYPHAPSLFPGDETNALAIDQQLLEFDTLLALPARRFGYSQLILETPATLSDLFLHGLWRKPVLRTLAGHVLGAVLCKRFEFHRSERNGLYEALEHYLLQLAARLEGKAFVVGDAFSAADLAFAAQLRPLTIVPFFAEHPALQSLFQRHRQLLADHSNEGDSAYQLAITKVRQNKSPVRRRLRDTASELPFAIQGEFAANDQTNVWDRGMWAMPYHYMFSLRQGKLRQALANASVR
jgi:glutathione S-transferase